MHATFQKLMNRVIAGLEDCAVYLNVVTIYSDTLDNHLQYTQALTLQYFEVYVVGGLHPSKYTLPFSFFTFSLLPQNIKVAESGGNEFS